MNLVDFLIGIFLGICGIIVVLSVLGGGGGMIIKGTREYDDHQRSTNERVENLFKNGITSSKEELSNWWNTYHPPK